MTLTERIVKVKGGLINVPVSRPDGEQVMVIVETVPRTRSLRANRYWWSALMRALSDYTGDTPRDCHEWLVTQLRPKQRTNPITGEIYESRERTSEMSSGEFAELCIEAQALCEKIGLKRISPEEYQRSLEQ